MTAEKVIGDGLPTIDRGTSARTRMSRKRFLAFTMVGIMIVAAVTMVGPAILQNTDQDNDNDGAGISWNPAGAREAIYKIDHLFEMYFKNGRPAVTTGGVTTPAIGWGGAGNNTKAFHGGATAAQQNQPGRGAKIEFLGRTNQSQMGVNDWLNTSAGNSFRAATYAEMTVRNNYPYIFYNAEGSAFDVLTTGLGTWAPYRVTAVVKNDTAMRTGYQDSQRNVPFIPYWGHGAAGRGGQINISLYGNYMQTNDLTQLRAGTHFGNWFYAMPTGTTPMANTNDGYYFELHGRIDFSRQALMTFLNWSGVGDARAWFNATRTSPGGYPPASGLAKWWWDCYNENFSQDGNWINKKDNSGYWNCHINNGNFYTAYEFDMVGSGGLWFSMKYDPWNGTDVIGGTSDTQCDALGIRIYVMGWGPDAMLVRELERAGVCGNSGTVPGAVGYWTDRVGLVNYPEDFWFNASIRESMSNTTWRQVLTYCMTGWEDDANDVWSGGYMIDLAGHADYWPNDFGAQDSYPSPMNKYQTGGANDVYTGTQQKSYNWNGPGALRFNTNASVCLFAPMLRNISAYEAYVIDLNLLSSPWLVAKGWTAKYGAQTMALQPYRGLTDTPGVAKFNELNRWLYWGTTKIGKGSLPQAQVLAGYNAATKLLNLSGGSTGLAMPLVFNQDYWGGRPGQTSRIYTHSQPFIQIDVAAVHHYLVEVGPTPLFWNTNYWVKVTPLNATNQIPKTNGSTSNPSHVFLNHTVVVTCPNDPAATWPGNGSSHLALAFNNVTWPSGVAFTTIRFGTGNDNTYVNVTDGMFTFVAGDTQTGTSGPLFVDIPEFATVLIPVIGMMAMFLIFRSRKKRRGE
jgi:hypothetical protein